MTDDHKIRIAADAQTLRSGGPRRTTGGILLARLPVVFEAVIRCKPFVVADKRHNAVHGTQPQAPPEPSHRRLTALYQRVRDVSGDPGTHHTPLKPPLCTTCRSLTCCGLHRKLFARPSKALWLRPQCIGHDSLLLQY